MSGSLVSAAMTTSQQQALMAASILGGIIARGGGAAWPDRVTLLSMVDTSLQLAAEITSRQASGQATRGTVPA